jgi:hypothetical protein
MASFSAVGTEPAPPEFDIAAHFGSWRDDLRVVRIWHAAKMRTAALCAHCGGTSVERFVGMLPLREPRLAVAR